MTLSRRDVIVPTLSRRVVLGTIASVLWPARLLVGQEPAIGMIPVEGQGTRYWPRWRGPSGQGLVELGDYPDRWSATENILWRAQTSGRGNSSPIVWGDRVFLTTAYDGGRRLSDLAFQRSNGVRLWETFVPSGPNGTTHGKNGYASATPVTDGERVYASFGSRGLLALDLNGTIAWHHDLGPMRAYHGTAGSPLVYRDRVILYQDQFADSFIAAFDTGTGRPLWRTNRDAQVGWGTPVAVRVGDHVEIIVSGQRRVLAYDPDTGQELWRCSGTTREVIPTPVVGHGMVFCSSGRAGPTLAIRPGGRGDVTDSHLAWSSSRGSPFVPSPILYGDYLYMVNDMASIATCFEAETGRVVWRGRLGVARREGFSASPVAVGDKLFFSNDNGETFVLRAGPRFELLHVNKIDETTLASPALVDGCWYVRTAGHLVAIGR